jgi:chromosome segregation ATPase
LENGIPDAIRAKFSELPESLEEIDAGIHHEEMRAGCSVDVNPNVIDEYQSRKKTIEKAQKARDNLVDKINNHKSNYEEKKNKWLDDVVEMISEINVKFSDLFKQLKCAGEVQLSRPDNPEEFAKYGISIRVSFRSEEQMQELTAHVQSGGEKSVSTMLYMISLQEMTRCPFRVVDEINQVNSVVFSC